MSRVEEEEPATPAGRIVALQKSLPPAEGRRSRLGYISLKDLGERIGAGEKTVLRWTKSDTAPKPQYPSKAYRERLAELSEGRWTATDFGPPRSDAAERARTAKALDHLEELGARVDHLERRMLRVLLRQRRGARQLRALDDRMRALEQRREGGADGSTAAQPTAAEPTA